MDPPDGAPSSQEDIQKRCQREATSEKASGYLSSSVDEPVYKVMPDPTYTNVPREITLKIQSNSEVFRQLCKIGYLNDSPGVRNMRHTITSDYYEVDSEFVENFELFPQKFLQFVQQILQRYLVNSSTVLNNSHARCLNMFIISAFDMARDMLITPKKLEFAREKENELFKQLLTIAVEKGDEIRKMIAETIGDMRDQLIRKAEEYEFLGKLYFVLSTWKLLAVSLICSTYMYIKMAEAYIFFTVWVNAIFACTKHMVTIPVLWSYDL